MVYPQPAMDPPNSNLERLQRNDLLQSIASDIDLIDEGLSAAKAKATSLIEHFSPLFTEDDRGMLQQWILGCDAAQHALRSTNL